jgi:hypothetical protein
VPQEKISCVLFDCFVLISGNLIRSILFLPYSKQKTKTLKCTLVQALRLCTCRTARRGSRGIALTFHDHGSRRGWEVSFTSRPLFTPGKDPVPIVQEARWAPGPVWTSAENLAPTGFRSPDRPAVAIPTTLPGPHRTSNLLFYETTLCTTSLRLLSYLTASVSMKIPFLSLFCSSVESLLVLGWCLMSAANLVSHSKISVSNPSYLSLTFPWMEVDSEICDRWL